jgi:hypothetical protein
LRHLGRQYNIAGSTWQEQARVDFINDGAEDLRQAYVNVIYRAWDTKDAFVANLPATLANIEVGLPAPTRNADLLSLSQR